MARTLQGVVVSDSLDKTIVVRVDRRIQHPIYKKSYSVSKKYHVHDEENIANNGDTVSFIESRPYSKKKRWVLSKVVEEMNS